MHRPFARAPKGALRRPSAVLLSILLVSSVACKAAESARLPGDDVVLARVNQTSVTRYDLERALERQFRGETRNKFDDAERRKLLESMVRTRAMAVAMEAQMSELDKLALDKDVAAFREEQLVQRFIRAEGQGKPVSQTMVTEYYEKESERFGAKTVRHYELIGSARKLAEGEREKLAAELAHPEKETDFAAWSERLRGKGLPVVFQRGEADSKTLHPALRKTLTELTPTDPARAAWVEERLFLVRVTKLEQRPPAPLAQVAPQIRQELAAARLKYAVQNAADVAVKRVKVVYESP
jgi:hypothetical protein